LTTTAEALSRAGIEALEALDGVASVAVHGETLTVHTNGGNKAALLHALENHGGGDP